MTSSETQNGSAYRAEIFKFKPEFCLSLCWQTSYLYKDHLGANKETILFLFPPVVKERGRERDRERELKRESLRERERVSEKVKDFVRERE